MNCDRAYAFMIDLIACLKNHCLSVLGLLFTQKSTPICIRLLNCLICINKRTPNLTVGHARNMLMGPDFRHVRLTSYFDCAHNPISTSYMHCATDNTSLPRVITDHTGTIDRIVNSTMPNAGMRAWNGCSNANPPVSY